MIIGSIFYDLTILLTMKNVKMGLYTGLSKEVYDMNEY